MGSIPVLSGQEVVRVFELFGWSVARRRGSHIVMAEKRGNSPPYQVRITNTWPRGHRFTATNEVFTRTETDAKSD